jgi:hypothetical protein
MLMCQPHWFQVPRPMRDRVYLALKRWDRGEVTLLELREAQAEAVEAVTGRVQHPTLEGGTDT